MSGTEVAEKLRAQAREFVLTDEERVMILHMRSGKRGPVVDEEAEANARMDQRRERFFLVALQGLLGNSAIPYVTGDPDPELIKLALAYADESIEKLDE